MSRIGWVAWREFVATVTTRGFIVGVLLTPALIGVLLVALPALMDDKPPRVEGEVAIVDPTGAIAPAVAEYLAPDAIALRWDDSLQELLDDRAPEALRGLIEAGRASPAARLALESAIGEVPDLRVVRLDDAAEIEREKASLLGAEAGDGGRLALVVVDEHAVVPGPGADGYGAYALYVRGKLDERVEDEIQAAVRDAIVDARVRAAGLDGAQIEALTRVPRVRSTTVTAEGERQTNEVLNALLPAAFMVLLLVAVFTSGQYILTSTVEEKSSRVVEVLLSAVSPMELMAGKVLGHLGVGIVILVLYSGMGVAALVSFALLGLVDLGLLVYLFLFFLIAYLIIGSLMAAIGSAVNAVSEAQTLMTPIMVLIMIPWLLWMPISRNPDSTFAVVTSFLPPINSFVMLLRMTSTSPPPPWQVWASIAVGAVSVYGVLWFAAKVFRVGLLMYGKPPSFATLVRWARMA